MAKILGDELKAPTIAEVNSVINNMDNTSDISKPISNATQKALNDKADLDHTHEYATILNTPTALKNPEPLTIQGIEYDGSVRTEINIQDSSSSSMNVIEGGGVISDFLISGNGGTYFKSGILAGNLSIPVLFLIKSDKIYNDYISIYNYYYSMGLGQMHNGNTNLSELGSVYSFIIKKSVKIIELSVMSYGSSANSFFKDYTGSIFTLKIFDENEGLRVRLLYRVISKADSDKIQDVTTTIFESNKGDKITYIYDNTTKQYRWKLILADD